MEAKSRSLCHSEQMRDAGDACIRTETVTSIR